MVILNTFTLYGWLHNAPSGYLLQSLGPAETLTHVLGESQKPQGTERQERHQRWLLAYLLHEGERQKQGAGGRESRKTGRLLRDYASELSKPENIRKEQSSVMADTVQCEEEDLSKGWIYSLGNPQGKISNGVARAVLKGWNPGY